MIASRRPRRRLSHESRVLFLALLAGAPAVVAAFALMAYARVGALTFVTLGGTIVAFWLGSAAAAHSRVVRSLQTVSNMIEAVREGDYSMRARGAETTSALGLALWEVNQLADVLRRQRLDTIEASALLARVMESIDVAVFAFDEERRLRLVNRHGLRLLAMPIERAIGLDARMLGMEAALDGSTPRIEPMGFAGGTGRYELRRGTYRHDGRPHELLMISDLTRSLREEEREAWGHLIRVLSHEINNSLAPVQSLAGSLRRLSEGVAEPVGRDMREGLGVIEDRAQSLARFLRGYSKFARLPRPIMRPVDIGVWVRRVIALETRLRVQVEGGPPLVIEADCDQLDQLLINLMSNAVDAALETGGGVRVRWFTVGSQLVVEIEDDGAGLASTENLFIPFFTTKPHGTGIGLTLSRQIADSHGGTLALEGRALGSGCVARVSLPLWWRPLARTAWG